jgi:hypothetical protein
MIILVHANKLNQKRRDGFLRLLPRVLLYLSKITGRYGYVVNHLVIALCKSGVDVAKTPPVAIAGTAWHSHIKGSLRKHPS